MKGRGAEHVCCSPRCRFGSGKTSKAAEGESSRERMEKGVGIRLVGSRSGALRAPAASGSTEEWFSAGGDAFWIGEELEKLGEGWNLLVASMGLTED